MDKCTWYGGIMLLLLLCVLSCARDYAPDLISQSQASLIDQRATCLLGMSATHRPTVPSSCSLSCRMGETDPWRCSLLYPSVRSPSQMNHTLSPLVGSQKKNIWACTCGCTSPPGLPRPHVITQYGNKDSSAHRHILGPDPSRSCLQFYER
ncbi:hypothetical protein V8F33_007082 [Rhypophila sp. PSN 637]